MSTPRKEWALEGFIYYLLSVCVLAVQFFLYLLRSQQAGYMDFGGWAYFVSSCLSQAALVALIPYLLLYLPLALTGWRRTAAAVQVAVTGLLSVLIYLNSQVYALYRFHINGFVLNLVFGDGAGEIFEFAPMVYVKQALLFALLVLVFVGMWRLALYLRRRVGRRVVWPGIVTLVALTLFSQVYHAYGAFVQKPSVLKSTAVIPFYYPLTANRLMLKMGVVPPANSSLRFERTGTSVAYPRNPLQVLPPPSGFDLQHRLYPDRLVESADADGGLYAQRVSVCGGEYPFREPFQLQQRHAEQCFRSVFRFAGLLLGRV